MRKKLGLALIGIVALAAVVVTVVWVRGGGPVPPAMADSHDTIAFVGKNRVATAHGTFSEWQFTKAVFDPETPASADVELSIDLSSIDTKQQARDKHLRTADFFDVENYPNATLRFHTFEPAGEPSGETTPFTATLEWEMHGVQKTYENFAFEVVAGDSTRIKGSFEINRLDFGIGEPYSGSNPMSIREEIPIAFDVTLPSED